MKLQRRAIHGSKEIIIALLFTVIFNKKNDSIQKIFLFSAIDIFFYQNIYFVIVAYSYHLTRKTTAFMAFPEYYILETSVSHENKCNPVITHRRLLKSSPGEFLTSFLSIILLR